MFITSKVVNVSFSCKMTSASSTVPSVQHTKREEDYNLQYRNKQFQKPTYHHESSKHGVKSIGKTAAAATTYFRQIHTIINCHRTCELQTYNMQHNLHTIWNFSDNLKNFVVLYLTH